ncbi:sigma-70 family RNA polymerase sigma factor [Paenibacillus aurantiacus]|uniref:Sigma-70 family RNA polymerase sigma factor n=1 Tax=Paenibacillus aurantiacus TaxID=1936118 RepID=A0ABV5KRN7_9BACL
MITDGLIDKARRGDLDSFAEAIAALKDDAYRIAWSYLRDEPSSMDAVCSAVEKALTGIRKLKRTEYFKTWFIRIVINECHLLLRNRRREQVMEEPGAGLQAASSPLEDHLDLEQQLGRLLPLERMLIHLKYYAGFTFEEIATMTNLPSGTVKTKLYGTIKKLKVAFEPREG